MIFSIVIPTHNEEQNIGNLLSQLQRLTTNYIKEIIIIDSESFDGTLSIVESYLKSLPLRIVRIRKSQFNHGGTRNLGVRLSKGRFVCFFSADVSLHEKKIFHHLLEDFRIDKKVVAVFGKHIPYKNSPISHKLDVICWFEKFDNYTDHKGVLIQDKKKPFVPYSQENRYLWWPLSNTFSCYKRSFLIKNHFARVNYGEDLLMGKTIIEKGRIKIYDKRCTVIHSHKYDVKEYCKRLHSDFNLKYIFLRVKEPNNFIKKIYKIISLNETFINKLRFLIEISYYYFLKTFIFVKIRLLKNLLPNENPI